MSAPLLRRLRPVLVVAVVFVLVVVVVPALLPDGSRTAFPAWRSVDGVPLVDELPGSFVGVLRIARERVTEEARTSIVLGPGSKVPCEPVRVTVGRGQPFEQRPSEADRRDDCRALRLITLKTLPGAITIEAGGDTWKLDPSIRDPRSCQLGRDRTCAYWLFKGGRFAEPLEASVPRVQAGTPDTVLAVGDALSAGTGAAVSRTVGYGDAAALLQCAAAAAPMCADGLAAQER